MDLAYGECGRACLAYGVAVSTLQWVCSEK